MQTIPYLQSTINLTLPHQISPRDRFFPTLAPVHELRQIQLDCAQHNSLRSRSGRILLQDLKVYLALAQHTRTVHGQTYGNRLIVIPRCFVFSDQRLGRVAAMFRRGRGWEVPFHVRCTADQRHVIEINDLRSDEPVSKPGRNDLLQDLLSRTLDCCGLP